MEDLVMLRDLSIYAGKRVLVSGTTGFKGSWLALWLNELGANVLGMSLDTAGPEDHFTKTGLVRRQRHLTVDIRDAAEVDQLVREFEPEFVFHVAAQALVRVSYADPRTTFSTNVCGSVNVLEAVRLCPSVRALVYVTSDKCYKNREWIWGYRENDELGGRDPYSASKAAAELAFSAYLQSYFEERATLGAASVRAGNVIGGGDWAQDRIVPDCVRALRCGQRIAIRRPSARRPWQHVLEPLGGYLLLGARLHQEPRRYSGAWNFGPDDASVVSVISLVRQVIDAWGSGEVDMAQNPADPHEAELLLLDSRKAREALGWHPHWGLDESVRRTIAWYQRAGRVDDAYDLSCEQILAYSGA